MKQLNITFKILLKMGIQFLPFNRQSHKMVKHTQTIRWQQRTNYLRVFDHFVGSALKGLNDCRSLFLL